MRMPSIVVRGIVTEGRGGRNARGDLRFRQ